jgi:hypothetical protein
MKKNIFLWMGVVVLTIAGLSGCSSDNESSNFQVRNFANTGCKSQGFTRGETGDTDPYTLHPEYIEYKALANGYLSLNHVNVCFNCGTEAFNMQATISGNIIKIEERYKGMLANCICPYDLYGEVGPLADGDYTIIIYQKYEETDDALLDYAEYARFTLSYKNGQSGKIDLKEW